MNRNLQQIEQSRARIRHDLYWTARAIIIIAAIALLKNYAQWQ